MEYKLICIDMDGTLLNKQHVISEASKEAIKKAHDRGIHIVVSTGRMYTDAVNYSKLLGVKSPVIASNGAYIKDKDCNKVIYKSSLREDISLSLIKIFKEYNVKPTFYTPEKAYTGNIFFYLLIKYLRLKDIVNEGFNVYYVKSWNGWNSILKDEKDNIVKCELIDKSKIKLNKIKDRLTDIDEIEVSSSAKQNIEVTLKGVSKGKAAEILAAEYNIERENIIAIGDSENDLSMIEFAGTGIAMGNAIDSVKKKADYITDTNDNDGVAKAINHFINSEF